MAKREYQYEVLVDGVSKNFDSLKRAIKFALKSMKPNAEVYFTNNIRKTWMYPISFFWDTNFTMEDKKVLLAELKNNPQGSDILTAKQIDKILSKIYGE